MSYCVCGSRAVTRKVGMRMIHHVSAGESGRNSERKLPGFLGLTSFMCAHESPLCGLSLCSSQVLVFLSCVDGVFSHLEIPKRADPCVESPTPAFNNTSPSPQPNVAVSLVKIKHTRTLSVSSSVSQGFPAVRLQLLGHTCLSVPKT